MRDILEVMAFMVGIIAAVVFALFITVATYAVTIGPKSCEAYGANMSVSTKYEFWYGCFVTMPNGEVLPESVALDVLRQKYKVEVTQP